MEPLVNTNHDLNIFMNIKHSLEIKADQVQKLEAEISNISANLIGNNFNIELNELCISILGQASSLMRDTARVHLEKIVTDALQFVTQDTSVRFLIEESTTRNKPSYEFYVETMINGITSKQKPEDACGGGFVDIISSSLKQAYLEIFQDPVIMNNSFLSDEPGKMISDQMSVKFAEYNKFLSKQYNRQMIMITHNENLSNVADKTFIVMKDRNGISRVTNDITSISSNLILDSIKDIIDTNSEGNLVNEDETN